MEKYHIGCTPRELFHRCEWWEILGLLYYSFEQNVLERKYYEEEKEIAEINEKWKNGKLRTYYKPSMSPRVKEHIKKLMSGVKR